MKPTIITTTALAVIGTCLLIAAPASSEDDGYARSGFYLGVGVLGGTYTRASNELDDELRALGYFTTSIQTETVLGFELTGGYRLHPNLAIEAEFEMFSKAELDVQGLGPDARLRTWSFTGNAKGFLLTGRTQPYYLVGVGILRGKREVFLGNLTATDWALRFGGGLDFYITENVVAYAGLDYLLPIKDVEHFDYLSYGGGVRYRF